LKSFLKKTILLLIAGFVYFSALAFSDVYSTGSHPMGIGNAYISQYDISAVYHNQAGIAKIDSFSISLFYENRYLLKDMSMRGILIGIPTKTANFAIHYSSFGPAKWMESTLSVACSKQLSSKLSAGIQINYFGMKLPEDNSTASSCGAELGLIYQLAPNFFAGFHLANPFSIPIKTYSYNEKIPYRLRVGCHTNISDDFLISAEAEKSGDVKPIFKLGMEWQAIHNLYFRVGFNSGSTKLFSGIGFRYRSFKTDLAFSYHQYLGFTPSFSIQFLFK
jgi:hypothetical protein